MKYNEPLVMLCKKALASLGELEKSYPGHPPFISARNQLYFIIDQFSNSVLNIEELKKINLGVIAVREVENRDDELADYLHVISAEVEKAIDQKFQTMEFKNGNLSQYTGYDNFMLVSPDGLHRLQLTYEGEPPHGDAYHQLRVDGRIFPGLAWGCVFAFSESSRYVAFSWMAKKFERFTVVVDLESYQYSILPEYMESIKIKWPVVESVREKKSYTFSGAESWIPIPDAQALFTQNFQSAIPEKPLEECSLDELFLFLKRYYMSMGQPEPIATRSIQMIRENMKSLSDELQRKGLISSLNTLKQSVKK